MREGYDCEELQEFAERFGDKVATDMVQEVCEAFYSSNRDVRRVGRVHHMSSETHDREGANRTFTGYVDHGARCWEFEIEDGNWNGTVVKAWSRVSKYPAWPVQPQTAWMTASIRSVVLRYAVDGQRDLLIEKYQSFIAALTI